MRLIVEPLSLKSHHGDSSLQKGAFMAIHLLNPNKLPTAAGLHGDGNGLYLEVRANGTRYWLLRYLWQGKQKKMFHPAAFDNISNTDIARQWAIDQQRTLAGGVDPKADSDQERYRQGAPLFRDYALACITDWSKGLDQSQGTATKWLMTVLGAWIPRSNATEFNYCKPLHGKRLDDISTPEHRQDAAADLVCQRGNRPPAARPATSSASWRAAKHEKRQSPPAATTRPTSRLSKHIAWQAKGQEDPPAPSGAAL